MAANWLCAECGDLIDGTAYTVGGVVFCLDCYSDVEERCVVCKGKNQGKLTRPSMHAGHVCAQCTGRAIEK